MSQTILPRTSLQPLIMVGTGAHSVAAGATAQGLLSLFGANVIAGATPVNRFFSHKSAFTAPWKITGYAFFLGKESTAIGEMEAYLQTEDTDVGIQQNGILLGWSSAPHAASAYFEAARIIHLPCPIIILKDSELYFLWIAANLDAVNARNFDLQLHLYWTYARDEELT